MSFCPAAPPWPLLSEVSVTSQEGPGQLHRAQVPRWNLHLGSANEDGNPDKIHCSPFPGEWGVERMGPGSGRLGQSPGPLVVTPHPRGVTPHLGCHKA